MRRLTLAVAALVLLGAGTAAADIGSGPNCLALSADGRFLFYTNGHSNTLTVADTTTSPPAETEVDVGGEPGGVAVTGEPKGRPSKAYVSNGQDNTVTVVANPAATKPTTTEIEVGSQPSALALYHEDRYLFVSTAGDNRVTRIDVRSGTASKSVRVGEEPGALALSVDQKFLYVTNEQGNTLSVVTTAEPKVVATVEVGIRPSSVGVDGRGVVYVSNRGSNTVSIVKDEVVVKTIDVAAEPTGVVLSPDEKRLYVSHASVDEVSVVDTARMAALPAMKTAHHGGHSIAVSPDGKKVYLANGQSATVEVLTPR